ncbi:MAG: anthranilate synthase component I [candidate division Zixibacteria bacterium]|nr:anthranilate synthase component I [candidate division Zixibacteria bacterium]
MKVLKHDMPADLETPVSAFLKLQKIGARILLESVESTGILGRYSFIGMKPKSRIVLSDTELRIENGGAPQVIPLQTECNPLDLIREYLRQYKMETAENQPGLLGGAVGYIGYDAVRHFETIPNNTRDYLDLPQALLYLIDTLVVFDHVSRQLSILCLHSEDTVAKAEDKQQQIIQALQTPLNATSSEAVDQSSEKTTTNFEEAEFCKAVNKVKQHIVDGEVYQLVLSRRVHGQTEAEPFQIYRALRMLNPSPYMFFLDFDEVILIGSSPEALVKLEDGIATVRPIAGTRPRGRTQEEDTALSNDLIHDEKERAEHVMLVDLGRNDLGRCCEFGSVNVSEFMTIEKYSHVIHLTSNVNGKLNPGLDQFDLFKATFPAGTVSGAPKIRSMQLIEELEKDKRGPYAGAIGYFSLTGNTDWCIGIRTIVMKGKDYFLQAGAGIVADSVPLNEFQETNAKLAALRKAIQSAEEGF